MVKPTLGARAYEELVPGTWPYEISGPGLDRRGAGRCLSAMKYEPHGIDDEGNDVATRIADPSAVRC